MKEMDIIKTSDFILAATLFCLGHDVIGMERKDPRRVIFYFKKSSPVELLVKDYFSNKIQVNPLEFSKAQRDLRAQMNTDL